MMGPRALSGAALGDAGLRHLAGEWSGPRPGAALGAGRGGGAGAQGRERRVIPRKG
jgi:hypothetical protein